MSRLFKDKVDNEATKLFSKIQEIANKSGAKIIDDNVQYWLNNEDKGFTIKLTIKKDEKNEN